MQISSSLNAELQRFGAGPGKLSFTENNGEFEILARQVDPLAVAFDSLVYNTARLAKASLQQLSQTADHLASRLTYLLEPLRIIEVDGDAGAVQMRSLLPPQAAQRSGYYELLVQRGGFLTLLRYEKQPAKPREVIPATVTREVLHRLVEDFSSAVR